jgi:FAD/FMN-containing dehydrogenase
VSSAGDLRAAVPAIAVRTDDETLDAASVDALRPWRGRPDLTAARTRPLAVAEPATTAEVAALVRWAAGARVALVPRGGGSGLMGGAAVLARPAIVVSLARIAGVAVDAAACLVRAGAGATLAAVGAALAPHGLLLAHDPWTVGVATVGGAISSGGLGFLGARAGGIGAQVRGLEAVLGDGTVVRTPALPARSAGLDLGRLLVGTEGVFGIVTEATLEAPPVPEERIVRGWRLPSFDAGVAFAAACRRQGIRAACVELSAEALPPAPAALLVVFDGLAGEAALHAARAEALLADAGAVPAPPGDAERQWAERHAIAERWAASPRFRDGDWLPAGGRGQFDYAHVGVPLVGLAAVRAETHDLVRRHGVRLVEESLWHWPELYAVVVGAAPDAAPAIRAVIDGVCRAAQHAGGTMEYCHGVGRQLAHLMESEHGPQALDVLRRLKTACDPADILNPGKADL